MAVFRVVLLTLLLRGSWATMLFNGIQSQVLTPNMTEACDAAFNTSISCPADVMQWLTYPMQSVGWNTSALQDLCTTACESSLTTLKDAVSASCSTPVLRVDDQNVTLTELVDHIQYKYGLICLKDTETDSFCSDIENSWNISKMVQSSTATWPKNTNKCYLELTDDGTWGYSLDENGNCTDPFETNWAQAKNSFSSGMAALDYYVTRPAPIDDDNYGWSEALEYDEYPLEIQCSSCFQNKFKYGMENKWGDVWDEVSEQVWANMKLNCDLSTVIEPANNLTGHGIALGGSPPPSPVVSKTCPQNLTISGDTTLSCRTAAIKFGIPLSGIRNLNPDIYCPAISDQTICAPLSCPLGIVNLGATIDATTDTKDIANYIADNANFTISDFYRWNPYIDFGFVRHGDPICIGLPGGIYTDPAELF